MHIDFNVTYLVIQLFQGWSIAFDLYIYICEALVLSNPIVLRASECVVPRKSIITVHITFFSFCVLSHFTFCQAVGLVRSDQLTKLMRAMSYYRSVVHSLFSLLETMNVPLTPLIISQFLKKYVSEEIVKTFVPWQAKP